MFRLSAKNLVFALVLGFISSVRAQETKDLLFVRVLEKFSPIQVEVQAAQDPSRWDQVRIEGDILWVNGQGQKRFYAGTPDSTVKLKFQGSEKALETRVYPGLIQIQADPANPGQLLILNEVSLEDYAACVTAFESGFDRSQPEYLKALGAVVGLYAAGHRHRHEGYDLCDLSHCQVYHGLPPRWEFWKNIVTASRDFRVDPKRGPATNYYFHRCCGGVLESSAQVWGGVSGLSRVGPDELDGEVLCQADSFFHWTSSTSVQSMSRTFQKMEHLPESSILTDLMVAERTPGGRAKTLAAFFDMPDGSQKEVRENMTRFASEFGKSYGWRVFPSFCFDLQRSGDQFGLKGRGFGHGVGLCQSGAYRLAQKGWDWEKIFAFYFPKTAAR